MKPIKLFLFLIFLTFSITSCPNFFNFQSKAGENFPLQDFIWEGTMTDKTNGFILKTEDIINENGEKIATKSITIYQFISQIKLLFEGENFSVERTTLISPQLPSTFVPDYKYNKAKEMLGVEIDSTNESKNWEAFRGKVVYQEVLSGTWSEGINQNGERVFQFKPVQIKETEYTYVVQTLGETITLSDPTLKTETTLIPEGKEILLYPQYHYTVSEYNGTNYLTINRYYKLPNPEEDIFFEMNMAKGTKINQ